MIQFALKTFCPFCFGATKTANNLWRENAPKNGDYGMCKVCGEFSVFCSKGTRLRKPTPKEKILIRNHPGAITLRGLR